VVAGARYARVCTLPVARMLPVEGRVGRGPLRRDWEARWRGPDSNRRPPGYEGGRADRGWALFRIDREE
jgi:hypothetical protein